MNDHYFSDELFDLVERHCVGTLDADGARNLRQLVVTNTAARAEYVRLMDLHGRLVWSLRGMPGIGSTPNVAGDSQTQPQPPTPNAAPILTRLGGPLRYMTRPVLGSIALVALVFYGIFALLAWNLRSDNLAAKNRGLDSALAVDEQSTFTMKANRAPSEIVARITDGSQCVWQLAEGQTEPQVGSKLSTGEPLELISGTAELTFVDGAKMLLQGPAFCNLQAANRAALSAGRIVAHVPPQAVGFTIETPSVTLVDRGTEFGVSVDPLGQTDIQVFTGAVDISYASQTDAPNAKRRTVRMTAGRAKRFSSRANASGVAVTEVAPWPEAAEAQRWLASHRKNLPVETKYAAVVLADQPLAYWRLSDHGNRAAEDTSGHGIRATYEGLVSTNNPGICPTTNDQSVRFLGKMGAGRIEINDFEMPPSFTIEFWARSATPNWNTDSWLLTAREPHGLFIHPDAGRKTWQFILMGNTLSDFRCQIAHTPESISDRFHHYVVAYDSATDHAWIYFDGVLIDGKEGAIGDDRRRLPIKLPLYIGADATVGSGRFGEGWIDELAIYDRALSAENIHRHFEAAEIGAVNSPATSAK